MHKTTGIVGVVLIAIVIVNAGPPSSYFMRGPPPQSPRYGHGPPQGPPPPSYKIKPAGSSKIFGWLGSQMAKIPNFLPKIPHYSKYNGKPNYHPPNYQAVILPIPGHGHGSSGGPEKIQINGPTYHTTSSLNEIYQPGHEYSIPGGFGSGSGTTSTVYVTSSGSGGQTENYQPSSGGYTVSSPYEHQLGHEYQSPSPAASPSHSVYTLASPSAGPSPYSSHSNSRPSPPAGPSHYSGPPRQSGPPSGFQSLSQSYSTVVPNTIKYQQAHKPPSALPRPQLLDGSYQQVGQSQISYQRVPAQKVFSPAPPQMFGPKHTSGNVEVFPSKMISYEKETLSTGHPDYLKAVGGLATAESSFRPMLGAYPTTSYQSGEFHSQNQAQGQTGYKNERIDNQFGSLFQGASPQVAPLYDLSALDLGSSSRGQNYVASASTQQQTYAPAQDVPQTVSLESLLSSFGGQQSQDQYQTGDSQGQYSHQYEVALPAPTNTNENNNYANSNYQVVEQSTSSSNQAEKQEQDLTPSESSLSPGVQLLSHDTQDGNPVFEVIADANAPTYNGGHPFDINQLISMIEPGAQFDDIQAEGSESHDSYAETNAAAVQDQIQQNQEQADQPQPEVQVQEQSQPEVQSEQTQGPSQELLKSLVGQTVQDESGQTFTVVQQGTKYNFTKNILPTNNNPNTNQSSTTNKKKFQRKTWTIPPLKNKTNETNPLVPPAITNDDISNIYQNAKTFTSNSNTNLYSRKPKPDLIINKFQKSVGGGNKGLKASPPKAQPHDPSTTSTDTTMTADNFDVMTFGPENKFNVTRHYNLPDNTQTKQAKPQLPFSSRNDYNFKTTPTPPPFVPSTTTFNPLSFTRAFYSGNVQESSLIYHTVKPFVSSNRNVTQHPNHNYKDYKVTTSTTNSNYPLLRDLPGLVPTVNPLFDSVVALDDNNRFKSGDDIKNTQEGDLSPSASRLVKAVAITVTPPPHLLSMKDKMVANRPTVEEKAIETSTASSNLISNLFSNQVNFSNSDEISSAVSAGITLATSTTAAPEELDTYSFSESPTIYRSEGFKSVKAYPVYDKTMTTSSRRNKAKRT